MPPPAVEQQLHSRFKPNLRSLAINGHASYTYSLGNNKGSANFGVDYSISGGDPNLPEAVLIPDKAYDDWLPEAGKDESTPGNTMTATVRLHKRGAPDKPPDKIGRFKFVLSEVSHEMGVSVNHPLKSVAHGGPDWPDLKIDQKANPDLDVAKDGQSATSKRSAESATVTLTSYDFGAYGHLSVTALLDDGTEIAAHVEGGDKYDLTIPRDDDGNHIADWWDKR